MPEYGMLYVPEEMSFDDVDEPNEKTGYDEFLELVMEHMSKPLSEREAATAGCCTHEAFIVKDEVTNA